MVNTSHNFAVIVSDFAEGNQTLSSHGIYTSYTLPRC